MQALRTCLRCFPPQLQCKLRRHYTVINIFFAEANLRQQLGPSAEAVSDIDGLFSWMDETYFPFVWDMKGNSSQQELVGGVLALDGCIPKRV
eukprot:1883457-Amphidinium_carterae.1